MAFSRRQLLGLVPALAGGTLLPRALRGAGASDRKFLFIFCPGGWDPAWALAPVFGSVADMPEGATLGTAGGHAWVDNPMSPAVGEYFRLHGEKTCVVHGIESRSVAHDVCLRLILTGQSNPGHDDWPLLLAAGAGPDRTMPYVNVSGPCYAGANAASLVRVGEAGQLAALLDGSAVAMADVVSPPPDARASRAVGSLLAARRERWSLAAGRGRESEVARAAADSLGRLDELVEVADELDLAGGVTLSERAAVAARCLERGLSTVGMVEYYGWQGLTWDTHGGQTNQSNHFQELFTELPLILADLAARPGAAGGSLAEEVTVVVMSEMGRFPKLNSRSGKEHWTFTSAMLIGSGVRGGQSIGGYDPETYRGTAVDLGTGEPGDTMLVPGHFGGALLQLAGLDAVGLTGVAPLAAVLEEA
jgi:uncharacterized protein (DUF1501 family)